MFERLSSRYDRIPAGQATLDAENGLELGRCAYFYVARCDPLYGDVVIVYSAELVSGKVAPFDTGGFWEDRMTTKPAIPKDQKAEFIASVSLLSPGYKPEFVTWVEASFAFPASYVEGEVPKNHYLVEVDITDDRDAKTWTWEARILVDKCQSDKMPDPVAVFLQEEQRRLYLTWLRRATHLPLTERRLAQRTFFDVHQSSGTLAAAAAAAQFLESEMT